MRKTDFEKLINMKTKTFFYSIYPKSRTYGKTILNVYRIEKNAIESLGLVEVNETNTRGYHFETFIFLINNRFLPKSYYKLSYCEWIAKGIKIIGI